MPSAPLGRPAAPIQLGGGFALRPWRLADAGALVAALDGDDAITRWLPQIPQPYGRSEAEAFIASTIRAWDRGLAGAFAIVDGSDVPVGSVALNLAKHEAPSVAYWVAEGARGQGLAVRATQAVAQLAFEEVGADRVIIHTQPDNTSSRSVARRAGFSEHSAIELADGITRIVWEQPRSL